MADIQNLLQQLLTAIYGKDVRQAIVDAIKQCYNDASEGLVPVVNTRAVDNGVQVTITVGVTSKSFIIEDGYTPIRGTDYWTEDDIAVINEKMQSLVIEESAKRGQLRPEFANSIDECTDTSKVYVLPDGYIYGYVLTLKTKYTNQIPISIDQNGNIVGIIKGTRYNSSDTLVNESTCSSTGFIPVSVGAVLNFKNIHFNGSSSAIDPGAYYIRLYDSSFGNIGTISALNLLTPENAVVANNGFINIGFYDNGDMRTITIAGSTSTSADISYMRMSFITGPEEPIITVDEEITEEQYTKEYSWENTGLAFVPADYEERILQLEETAGDNAKAIADLEQSVKDLEENMTSDKVICPDYWVDAIDALSDTVKPKQASGVDAFQFIWFSDMHGVNGYVNTNGAGTSSQVNIGKVSQYICDKYDIPLVITSGDIMSQASHTNASYVYAEYKNCRDVLSYIDTSKFLATIGNHDGAWGAPVNGIYYRKDIGNRALYNEVYRRQATDLKRVFGADGTYFYIDSHPQKVRILMLNGHTDGDGSNDKDGLAVYSSMWNSVYGTEQLQWIADTLNSVPEGYSVIAFAHEPLTESKDGELIAALFESYNSRTSYNGEIRVQSDYWGNELTDSLYNTSKVTCNFTNAKGEFVAFFHGHIHYDRIDTTTYSFPCISITTAGGDVRDSNPIERVVGTATETALDVVSIDKLNRKIYMTRVGAGSDREISY